MIAFIYTLAEEFRLSEKAAGTTYRDIVMKIASAINQKMKLQPLE